MCSRVLVCLILFQVLGACSKNVSAISGAANEPIPAEGTKVQLSITGYNYTNRPIDQFSVNSNGGGNLHVSSLTSGGGGSVCCISYIVGLKKWRVRVRWQAGACTYNNEIFSNGERGFELFDYFKETEVEVDPSVPARPNNLEVHFYPDGHLEVAVTEDDSPPRLRLPKEREDRSHYGKCPTGQRRAGWGGNENAGLELRNDRHA